MLNNVVIVGRMTKDISNVNSDEENKKLYITLAVPRTYKNIDGEYDTDFISVVLWNAMADHVCEYCKKGDILGIKGHIETSHYEKDGEMKYCTEIVAEKVTFLSSKKEE